MTGSDPLAGNRNDLLRVVDQVPPRIDLHIAAGAGVVKSDQERGLQRALAFPIEGGAGRIWLARPRSARATSTEPARVLSPPEQRA